MNRFSDDWFERKSSPTFHSFIATAHAEIDAGQIVPIHWQREEGNWFSAWRNVPGSPRHMQRASRLDASDEEQLGGMVGQVVTPGMFNYGPGGVLENNDRYTGSVLTDYGPGFGGISQAPDDGHAYECCGKVGRISAHKAWCKVNTVL